MHYLSNTPHCGRYCWRALDGTEVHNHGNAKRGRRQKHKCKDDCCVTPRRVLRRRAKQALRQGEPE